MKNLLIILFNIIAIIGLTLAAYAERGYYTIGGEVVLLTAIFVGSICYFNRERSNEK